MYRGWVGKAKIRQPGKYKFNKTFCHLILRLQFFQLPGALLSELSYDIKILSQFLTHGYALKQIDGVVANTVCEKTCVENLATYSHFFSTRPYYEYCSLNLCNNCLLCYEQFIWFGAHLSLNDSVINSMEISDVTRIYLLLDITFFISNT